LQYLTINPPSHNMWLPDSHGPKLDVFDMSTACGDLQFPLEIGNSGGSMKLVGIFTKSALPSAQLKYRRTASM